MRKTPVRQNDSATWSADGEISTDIDKVGLITRIDVTVELTPSATLSGANQADGLWRLIQNMRIEGGSHTYFNLPGDDGAMGGTLLHYLNVIDGFGHGHENGDILAPSETYVPVNFVLHCGSRPRDKYGRDNPFDLTAFIPAYDESSLTALWKTSGNDVVDDTVTINSAVARFTLHRITGTEAEILAEMERQEVPLPPGANGMVPAWSSVVHANAGATTDFDAEQVDVVVGTYLKRIALLFQDATADRPIRASDQVTEVALKSPNTTEELIKVNVEYFLSRMAAGSTAEGILALDLRPLAQSIVGYEYGLDLRNAQNGAFKLGFLISNRAAGDDTLIIYERYQPYIGPLGKR